MRPLVIELSGLAFLTLFFLQAILSRLYRPKSEDKFVIVLYTLGPIAIFLGSSSFNHFHIVSTPEALAVLLLTIIVGAAWVASYPAIYAVCPTLVMAYMIRKSPKGITASDIAKILSLKENSAERLNDALHDNLVRKNGDVIELTQSGRIVYLFFSTYRRIIGLKLETL